MYSFDSKIRYSEIGKDKKLTIGALVDYFQDCSTFHSEEVGLGFEYLEKEKKAWLLSSWQIDILRFPEFGETIKCATWAYDFKNFYGYRNFAIIDQTGEYIVKANSIWFFMDLVAGRPVKIDESQLKGYVREPMLDMEYLPRKLKTEGEFIKQDRFLVKKSNIDTNNHVNNGQYVKMAADYLPDDFKIKRMRAEYKKAALLGDAIVPAIANNDNEFIVSLCDEEEKPYAVVKFV